ncbi:MAG: cupin domain-containing protein [Desulfarculaceae bacterium]|nr:cupin domain-containing protein [Desulfarculaceae bacterium]
MSQKSLGARIASFRQSNDISLRQMAERTGLEESFLRAVEEQDLYPSLGPLLKIARALGVRLGTFLDDKVSRDPLIVRLSEREQELVTHRGDQGPVDTVFYSLGRGKTDRHMEPFFVEIGPASGEPAKLSSHEGEEFIVVTQGRVELTYGRETTVLEPGDSMYYNSVVPHHLTALDGEKASIYAVLYFPE